MLTIRRGGPDDVVHLASLRFEWRSRERGEKGLDQQSFEKELKEWTREHENSHVPFLAFETERPVGMAWLAVVDRIPGPEFFVRRSGYVQSVYVVPNQRSQGVGTADTLETLNWITWRCIPVRSPSSSIGDSVLRLRRKCSNFAESSPLEQRTHRRRT